MSKKNKKIEEIEEIDVQPEEVDEVLLEMLENYNPDSFPLANGTYRLVKEYRDGFDYETLIKRYNDVLSKYDYIVGDWGYDQLRLRGFFKDDFKSAPLDAKINTLNDYLYEFCNFGCAYFVIEQIGDFKRKGRSSSFKPSKNKNQAHINEKKYDAKNNKKPKPKGNNQSRNNQSTNNNKKNNKPPKSKEGTKERHFKIKKKED
ncbi:YutD family protein [Vagococcus bubulae]|uniref:Transcriptional regulator n=1 Tax=Vagococcus bubulae TaxID=1977868 RepID=A0A429ZKM8_9ENTE|nr:YutD family protein [Vagococcus bubulae]RST94260.1 hypothetical protein CBF36_06385 [Vagococcus bubulae]